MVQLLLVYDKSLYSRHELGYVASLKLHGFEPLIVLIDETCGRSCGLLKERIEVNGGVVEVPIVRVQTIEAGSHLLKKFTSEAVVSLPRKPFAYAWRISRRLKVPLIARFWSIRALKIVDNLRYGAYGELLLFYPSLALNILEAALSDYAIVVDHPMYEVLRLSVGRVVKIYPPAGFRPGALEKDVVERVRELEPYAIAVTVLSKRGPYLKFEAKPHALLFYGLAKAIPDLNFILVGSTKEDFVRVFPELRDKIPPNLYFVGRGFSDTTLKELYRGALLSVNYISNRNISNRLLEALALGVPVVVNSMALKIYPELSSSLLIADSVEEYQKMILRTANDDEFRLEVVKKQREAYLRYFSPRLNFHATKSLVEALKHV